MRLSEQVRCRQWGDCGVGKRASDAPDSAQYADAVVWPLDFMGQAVPGEASRGQWRVYLNMGNTGRHQTWNVCREHHMMLYNTWVELARNEVELELACHRWWEATGT